MRLVKWLYSNVNEVSVELDRGDCRISRPFIEAVILFKDRNCCARRQMSSQDRSISSSSNSFTPAKDFGADVSSSGVTCNRFPLHEGFSYFNRRRLRRTYLSFKVLRLLKFPQIRMISLQDSKRFRLRSSSTIFGHTSLILLSGLSAQLTRNPSTSTIFNS